MNPASPNPHEFQESNDTGLPESDATMMGDEAGDFAEQRAFEQHTSAVSFGKLKLSRTNLILIGMFAAGLGGVYLLSMRGAPEAANANDRAVEQQVSSFISEQGASPKPSAGKNTKKIVEAFYNYTSRHQVPLNELQGNPFQFRDPSATGAPAKVEKVVPTAAELAVRKQKADIEAEFARLKLQSIMTSPRGATAIINSNFLSTGQRCGSFTVGKISAREVELKWNQDTFMLRIEE